MIELIFSILLEKSQHLAYHFHLKIFPPLENEIDKDILKLKFLEKEMDVDILKRKFPEKEIDIGVVTLKIHGMRLFRALIFKIFHESSKAPPGCDLAKRGIASFSGNALCVDFETKKRLIYNFFFTHPCYNIM